jgi:OPA family sugar phosphate sensor protein UhpC-like MFS transporter
MNALLRYFATGPDQPQLTDSGAIDQLYRRHRLRVMLAITLGYGVIYTCRLALGVVKKPLIDGGIFGPAELGVIGSALFYTYAIGKLTNGFLADHANMKKFLAAGFLLSALCNVGMGLSTVVWASALLWGLNGWFQSLGAPGGVVAMTAWFSNRERGRYYGIWSTAHSIGEGLTFIGVGTVVAVLGCTGDSGYRRSPASQCPRSCTCGCRIDRARSDCQQSPTGATITTPGLRRPRATSFARSSRS